MLGVIQKRSRVLQLVKDVNGGGKDVSIVKARDEAYQEVTEEVNRSKKISFSFLIQRAIFMKIHINKNRHKDITL